MPAFARPWRSVERTPPAILHAWPDEYVKINASESYLEIRLGKNELTLMSIGWCTGEIHGPGISCSTLPIEHILGAKVRHLQRFLFMPDRTCVICKWTRSSTSICHVPSALLD